MRLAFVGGAVGAFALMVGVQAATAGGNTAVQTDPRASSPAGVIYQIPLDNGRSSAAPVLPVGSRKGGGAPGDQSSIHSENGFGSSSRVPGVTSAALRVGVGVPAAGTAGSALPTYLLLALVAAAAIAGGVLAAGARRRRSGGAPKPPMDV